MALTEEQTRATAELVAALPDGLTARSEYAEQLCRELAEKGYAAELEPR